MSDTVWELEGNYSLLFFTVMSLAPGEVNSQQLLNLECSRNHVWSVREICSEFCPDALRAFRWSAINTPSPPPVKMTCCDIDSVNIVNITIIHAILRFFSFTLFLFDFELLKKTSFVVISDRQPSETACLLCYFRKLWIALAYERWI